MALGDHLKVRRFGYTHHGIDVGDGTVVHFSGEPLRIRDACVCRELLEDFLQGGTARVVRHDGSARDPEIIVAEALKRVGERGYDLWRNNCEHFATYCVTGRKKSRQVRRVLTAAGGIAAGVLVVTAAVAVEALRRRNGETNGGVRAG